MDERLQAGTAYGWGAAFSFSRLLAEKWEPFVRAGYAENGGALWERSLSTSLGYHTRRASDVIGLVLNWGRPSFSTLGSGLDDQSTSEIYYRIQVLKTPAITPDIQFLINSAFNPAENLITVFGIRG